MARNKTDQNAQAAHGVFPTTRWTQIVKAAATGRADSEAVLNALLSRYWKPVYLYVRRKGYGHEEAKDLTQDFFHQVVLGRDLVGKADEEKGRFRCFLQTALDHYVIDFEREKRALKRKPQWDCVSLAKMELLPPQLCQEAPPEDAFNYAWASQILERVLVAVEAQLCDAGREAHWKVFRDRVLRPILEGAEAPSMSELCEEHGIESETKSSNMLLTAKRRFRATLRQHMRQYVDSDDDIDAEIDELIRILGAEDAR